MCSCAVTHTNIPPPIRACVLWYCAGCSANESSLFALTKIGGHDYVGTAERQHRRTRAQHAARTHSSHAHTQLNRTTNQSPFADKRAACFASQGIQQAHQPADERPTFVKFRSDLAFDRMRSGRIMIHPSSNLNSLVKSTAVTFDRI